MESIFDFSVISNNFLQFMIGRYPNGPLGGLALTLILAFISVILSIIFGLILGLLCISRNSFIRIPVSFFVNLIRAMPLLMVIFWMFFLLPALTGGKFPENGTVVFALTIFTSCYISQIVKAGIASIPKGQTEASLSSGLTYWQTMRYVVLPQGLRNMIPSFVNQFVSLIKDTSLGYIVGVSELTQVAQQINNRTQNYAAEIFIFLAIIYFIICFAFTTLSRWLEKNLAWRKSI
ncbi:ABC transporter permease subunit [Silvanigrella paludirubra]|uniref:Glutamate/aspartate import permease protein GltK n=1 Tax=Silvanigrella paludirubra TaxID=2499159 RepID=A0A6N6W0E4_9BACT|nr:amino acid ABC transporter permease [Silvanigrella paludirubra]KAB8040708.1 ABC transporter permease subunit [Silvanigrella paludirubra]